MLYFKALPKKQREIIKICLLDKAMHISQIKRGTKTDGFSDGSMRKGFTLVANGATSHNSKIDKNEGKQYSGNKIKTFSKD